MKFFCLDALLAAARTDVMVADDDEKNSRSRLNGDKSFENDSLVLFMLGEIAASLSRRPAVAAELSLESIELVSIQTHPQSQSELSPGEDPAFPNLLPSSQGRGNAIIVRGNVT